MGLYLISFILKAYKNNFKKWKKIQAAGPAWWELLSTASRFPFAAELLLWQLELIAPRPLLSTSGQCVTGIIRGGTSSVVTLRWSWGLALLYTRRRKQVSLLDSQPALNACSFVKSVSSPEPLEVSMTLSTGCIPAWWQKEISMQTAVLSSVKSTWLQSAEATSLVPWKEIVWELLGPQIGREGHG